MDVIYLKTGDTGPSAAADLNADLTGATVRFRMTDLDGTVVIDQPAVVDDVGQGLVHYAWGPTDTAVANTYDAEFVVTFGGGAVQTFPQGHYLGVIIREAAG